LKDGRHCVAGAVEWKIVATVKRRHVFYISGFDPRGPAHYHRLYKEEAAKQASINGLVIDIGQREKLSDTESLWRLKSAQAEVHYSFLRYDDVMRERWARTDWSVLLEILRYSLLMQRRGVFYKVLFTSWPTFVSMIYPLSLVVAVVVISLAAAAIAGWLGGAAAAAIAGIAAFIALIALRRPLEERINAFWIARILSFIADQGAGKVPALEARLDQWARRIATEINKQAADEVLIVGHSVGAQLAVSIAARIIRLCGGAFPPRPRLSLLTLGHTIPLQALQPSAERFRDELALAARTPEIEWIDVSAAIDSACFPLCDPVEASGLKQANAMKPSPKIVSARFPKLFTPETYKVLRRQFKRAHFQYLLSAEIKGDYDYFLITAGDKTLGERFAHVESVKGFDRFKLRKS
jgi:hypothetical protein